MITEIAPLNKNKHRDDSSADALLHRGVHRICKSP